MKYIVLVICFLSVYSILGCSTSKKSINKNSVQTVPEGAQIDSVDYFNDQFTITRLIDQKELDGKWTVTRMFRLQQNPPEKLTDVTLSFADSSFAGNAPCNSIAGDVIIVGSRVKFTNIIATKMACEKLEQEREFIQLLQNSVSVLTLREDKLLLRDRRGNNIFECVKEK